MKQVSIIAGYIHSLAILIGLVFLQATFGFAQPVVVGYDIVSETRVARTVFEYTMRATLKNDGPALNAVRGQVVSSSPHTKIIEGALEFGNTGSGAVRSSIDTLKLQHDRIVPF